MVCYEKGQVCVVAVVLTQTANYAVRTEDLPRAIPVRTIVYCLKQWPGAHLPRALYKVISLGVDCFWFGVQWSG